MYFTLPRRYTAVHWNVAWAGFDAAELVGLVATAWAAWRRRAIIVLFATATGTLMLADAWFDLATTRAGDLWQSALLAALGEIPGAVFLFYVVHRVLTFTRGTVWSDRLGDRPKSLWSVEFLHPSELRGGTSQDAGQPKR